VTGTHRIAEFGFPGELRDRLVSAILRGGKTATTGLLVEWELDREPLPRRGEWFSVVDSTETPVAVIEVRDVSVVRLVDVDVAVARDEGEGFESVRAWRLAHEEFWDGYARDLRSRLGDPAWALTDETPIVVQRFRLVRVLNALRSARPG
jgi:uncharacterized protein YhfF